MALFEGYERRIDQINAVLNSYGISSIEEAEKITKDAGLDVYDQVKKIQPICFENACWAYTVGAAIAIKKGCTRAADAAAAIGEGLQAFCIPGSVADHRKVGLGHGNLGKMLLEEETECFCFLAGHESFAAAEGAIGIAEKANKVRQNPLRVILNGLGKTSAVFLQNTAALSLRLAFVFFGIPRFGIHGCLWGMLASELFLSAMHLYTLKGLVSFSIQPWDMILKPTLYLLISVGICRYALPSVSWFHRFPTFFTVLIQIFLLPSCYIGLLALSHFSRQRTAALNS